LSYCQSYDEREDRSSSQEERLCVKASVKSTRVVVLAFSKTLGDSSVFKAAMIEEKADPMHYVFFLIT